MALFDPATVRVSGQFVLKNSSCSLVPFTQLSYLEDYQRRCYTTNYAYHAAAVAKSLCPNLEAEYLKVVSQLVVADKKDINGYTIPAPSLTVPELNAAMAAISTANKACAAAQTTSTREGYTDVTPKAGTSLLFLLGGVGFVAWLLLRRRH